MLGRVSLPSKAGRVQMGSERLATLRADWLEEGLVWGVKLE